MVGAHEEQDRPATRRPWNIDGLIPREPWEDRPRDGGLDARLETLERRLHAAVDRVEDVPAALERRLLVMEEQLRARDEELDAITGALERAVGVQLGARLSELAGVLATLEGRVEALGELAGDLAAIVGQLREDAADGRGHREAALRSVEARLVATVQATADALVADASEVVGEARTTGVHLDRLAARLADLDRVLTTHRGELTDVLVDDRRALTEAVVEHVVEGLRPRARRRLAGELMEGQWRRGVRTAATERSGSPATDADHLRATLAEVPGVGPVRADALVAAFGSVDRLGVSDVAEIVAFAGVPEPVAAAILSHVRGGAVDQGPEPAAE